MAMLYFQRFPDDLIKTRIILNDLEGFNIPKSVIEKLRLLFTKTSQSNGLESSKASGLDAFLNVGNVVIPSQLRH